MHSVTIRHNFETGHRIPALRGKCENLHGHSWWAEITVTAPQLDPNGTVVEFGTLKSAVRTWIDAHWDHGLILGDADPLIPLLSEHGKVYVIPGWPTVERVAEHLSVITENLLTDTPHAPAAYVSQVKVSETHVNAATWTAS